jgi:hypothetical protein
LGIIAAMWTLPPVREQIKVKSAFCFVLRPKANVTFQESSSFSLALGRNAKTWAFVNAGD